MANKYKELLASFNTSDFGEYSAKAFTEGNFYRKPKVYPSDSHPRILFTKNTVDKLRENINCEESRAAYERYIELSDTDFDGKFEPKEGERRFNYSTNKAAIIEAKAFRYAMTGEEKYGYEAIYAAKNAVLTIDVTRNVGDACRNHGHLMYVVSCTYDWCYNLLSEEDKKQIIAGCVNLLGKEFEMCRYLYDGNILPVEQGTAYGHGAEDQMLVDYLAFAIATYGDASEIYELVGGRVLNDYTEAQNFLLSAGSHWEGTMYGSVRTVATLVSNILIASMTDGKYIPFSPKLEDAVLTTTKYIRPDGHVYRIGDTNENNTAFQFVWMSENCFYAGNFYKNPYLKSVGYKYLNKFTNFWNMVAGLSCVQFLCINDPEVPHIYEENVPLTHRTYFPNTNIFAKSANDDKDAFGIFMTMPENCVTSHAHMECGSFQIYYKGPLASDSGAYDSWGGPHHFGYNMQTVSANSLLIYNPELKDVLYPHRANMKYAGGQSIRKCRRLPETFEGIIHHPALGQCKSLGLKNCEKNGEYLYSYMAGDMTGAYDDETALEVTRYMLAFATGDKKCPYAFMTYDRVTAKDASFKKAALIHVQEEPKCDGDFVTVTTTRRNTSGKMLVQTVGGNTDFNIIGGEGKQFWIWGVDEEGKVSADAGYNVPQRNTIGEGSLEEYGWGRIEISPKSEEKTSNILTVMYVTDQKNTDAPIKSEDVSSGDFAGAKIFGKQVYFPKSEKLIDTEATLEIKECGECFITGLQWDEWTVFKDGEALSVIKILKGENILNITLEKGMYTFKHTHRD